MDSRNTISPVTYLLNVLNLFKIAPKSSSVPPELMASSSVPNKPSTTISSSSTSHFGASSSSGLSGEEEDPEDVGARVSKFQLDSLYSS